MPHRATLAPLTRLTASAVDVLVIGGGITGACVALDAARRGFSVALIDRGDFGAGATTHCLRIVHGGLRYLQHLDFVRARASITERSRWLRAAPHLVDPLPVLVPTWAGRFPPRWMIGGALALNELLSADRNRGLPSELQLPTSQVLSRRAVAEMVPALDLPGLTGGALFHDAIMYSPDRLVQEVLAAARARGAVTANHVSFEGSIREGGRVAGAHLRDLLTGDTTDLRARVVVNAAGSAASQVAALLTGAATPQLPAMSMAMNLVTAQPADGPAFTLLGGAGDPDRVTKNAARQLFVVPWRGQRLIGTAHLEIPAGAHPTSVSEADVERFLHEVRTASPALPITRDDVRVVQWGLLPVAGPAKGAQVRLLKQEQVHDHAAQGAAGAYSVVSIKFTTARQLAAQVVDRFAVGRSGPATLELPGHDGIAPQARLTDARRRYGTLLPADVLEHLLRVYGARYEQVLALRDHLPDWNERIVPEAPVIRAQLAFGVQSEEARTPDDLLMRRTELGPRGLVTERARQVAAEMLSRPRA
jgi:glycerol-3-phosphate dehydrogenase